MACGLFGTKPLPETVMLYDLLDPHEQISVKVNHAFKETHYKYRPRNNARFAQFSVRL